MVWPPPISRTGDAASRPSRASTRLETARFGTRPDRRRFRSRLVPRAPVLRPPRRTRRSVPRDDRLQPAVFRRDLRRAGACGAVSRRLPLDRARVDGLWFVGGLGALVSARRDSPAGGTGDARLARGRTSLDRDQRVARIAAVLRPGGARRSRWRPPAASRRSGVQVRRLEGGAHRSCIVAGAWRVGDEPGPAWRPRLFGVPELVDNIAFDVSYWSGRMPRATYLERFGGTGVDGKFSALAVEALAEQVRRETRPQDRIYVFGFASGGVYAKSGRWSSSRFFWSRPVVIEFDAATPGYGSAGLLADLERDASRHRRAAETGLAAWRGTRAQLDRVLPRSRCRCARGSRRTTSPPRTAWCSRSGGRSHDLSRRRVLALSLLILVVGAGLRTLWLRADPPNDVGRHRLARRGRLGAQRAQPRAVGHVADRRVESDLHRAGVHRARIRRLRALRRRHLAGAHGARPPRASPPSLLLMLGLSAVAGPRVALIGGALARHQLHLRDVESRRAHGIDDDGAHRRELGGVRDGGTTAGVGSRGRRRGGPGVLHEGRGGVLRGGDRARRARLDRRQPMGARADATRVRPG